MAQIIKHRRGQLTGVKSLTARNAEFIIASGSISDLQGPFIFIGSPNSTDEGVAGAFKSVSKIYQGTAAPSITAGSYGSILDGTPFYASGNKSLYILNNDGAGGNSRIDLTGNIEGNTISGLTVNNLTGTTATFSSITGSFSGDGSNLTGLTADSALTASYVNPLVQDVSISGGLYVTGTGVFEKTQAFTPNNVDIKSAYASQLRFFVSGSQNGTIYSSNQGELVISANTLKLNNAVANGVFTGSFTGSFAGNGSGLYNIPASGITGLELNRIGDGSATASISQANGLRINTNTEITGALIVTGDMTGSNMSLSGDIDVAGNLNTDGNILGGGSLDIAGIAVLNSGLNVTGDLNITGNIYQTGSIELTGDITLGGNISIGDSSSDSVTFGAEVSSSIVPDVHNAFDLGSASKNWKDLHISGTAFVDTLQARQVNFSDLGILNDLTVSGSTFLGNAGDITVISGSVYNDQLTQKRLVVVGADGLITDYSGLTFDNGNLNVSGAIEVTNIQGTGSLYLKPDLNDLRDFRIYNTAPSDIHIKGNAGYSFFGDDTNYLKIDDSAGITTIVGVNGVAISSSLDLTGSLTATEESYFNNNIVVTGSITTDSLQVINDASFNTNIVVNGNATVDGSVLMQTTLEVSGDTLLHDTEVSGSVSVTGDVTANAFIGDGSQLTGIATTLLVSGSDGTSTTYGSLDLKTDAINFSGNASKGLTVEFNDTTNTIAYDIAQNIKTGATPTFSQLVLSTAGTTTGSAVRADRTITIDGTANQVSVNGGTQTLQGDINWTVSLPSDVDLGTGSTIAVTTVNTTTVNATDGNIDNIVATQTNTTGLTATTGSITRLTSTTGSFTNLNATNASVDTLTVTTGSFEDFSANTGSFGRVVTTDIFISGTLQVLGGAQTVYLSSSVVELDDNIIRLNAYSPFERYAGFEVMDSGSSGVSASLVWDSLQDYWMFVSSSGDSSKLIGTTAGEYGSEVNLTSGTFPIATAGNTIGDSLLTYAGTTLALNTNKFTVDSASGDTMVSGNFTLEAAGGTDAASKTSAIMFRNSSNVVGYVSTTETTDVLDGILGYKHTGGGLTFSTVIDGGTY